MQCIHVDCERPQIAIAVEQARCMRCGICADVCPVDALALTGAAGRGDREGKA
ncbi:MAG: 4Fe-4S binding protein [Anaerolineae bacterium]|nr:4Fe-4S binding protein [Anaerolineae bacterium]